MLFWQSWELPQALHLRRGLCPLTEEALGLMLGHRLALRLLPAHNYVSSTQEAIKLQGDNLPESRVLLAGCAWRLLWHWGRQLICWKTCRP